MDNQSSILEKEHSTNAIQQPLWLRIPAQVISMLFHPLFVPLYVVYFIIFVHPYYFSGFSTPDKAQVILIVLLNAVFFPLISVLLLKGVGFIQSIFLHTQKDRIIPYMAGSIFFFWTYHVFREQHQYPIVLTAFFFGVLLSASAALMANIYYKISMHAIGMGGLIGIGLVIMKSNTMLMTWPLCIAILIAGLVCTSRLLVSNHTNREIYMGLLFGMLCQLAAALIIT